MNESPKERSEITEGNFIRGPIGEDGIQLPIECPWCGEEVIVQSLETVQYYIDCIGRTSGIVIAKYFCKRISSEHPDMSDKETLLKCLECDAEWLSVEGFLTAREAND